jgi:hypothetical protein
MNAKGDGAMQRQYPERPYRERFPFWERPYNYPDYNMPRTVFFRKVTDERGHHYLEPTDRWYWRTCLGFLQDRIGCEAPGGDTFMRNWILDNWRIPCAAILHDGYVEFIK